jgi:hypothetical protein
MRDPPPCTLSILPPTHANLPLLCATPSPPTTTRDTTQPIYVWQSARPWDDLNLQFIGTVVQHGSPHEILLKLLLNAGWMFYLCRVIMSVVSEYVMLSRDYYMHLRAVEDDEIQKQRAFHL